MLGLASSFGGQNKRLNIVDEDSDIYGDGDDGDSNTEGDDDVLENRVGQLSDDDDHDDVDEAETIEKKEG